MSKFFDQRFYPYFYLNAYIYNGTQLSHQTPAKVVFSSWDQRYMDGVYSYYRCVDILHCSGSGYGRHSTQLPLDPFQFTQQTPDIQNSSIEFQTSFYSSTPQDYYYSKFTLEFGDLSLPLTDEIISQLEDDSVKNYSATVDAGDDMVKMTNFSNFASRRMVIRGNYTNPNTTRHKSFLMTTSQSEEVKIPLTLTVSKYRRRPYIGASEITGYCLLYSPNLLSSGLYTEVMSTHEASADWDDNRYWYYLDEHTGVPSPTYDGNWVAPI